MLLYGIPCTCNELTEGTLINGCRRNGTIRRVDVKLNTNRQARRTTSIRWLQLRLSRKSDEILHAPNIHRAFIRNDIALSLSPPTLIKPDIPHVSYDPLSCLICYILTRIQTIVHSRYLCIPAPLATYYVQLLPRSFFVHSHDKYPRATTAAANSSEGGTSFLRGASPPAEFALPRPQPRAIHHARSLLEKSICNYSLRLRLRFAVSRCFARAAVTHSRQFDIRR